MKTFMEYIRGPSRAANRRRRILYGEVGDVRTAENSMAVKVVYGRVVSMQPNGFGVVKLEGEGEGYFDRFDVLGTEVRARGRIHEGARVKARPTTVQKELMHLTEVSLA